MILAPMRRFWQKCWHGLRQLTYPKLCIGCSRWVQAGNSCFCASCRYKIPVSDMYMKPENEFTQRVWGRLPLVSGAAFLYFTRKSVVQRALHELKYRNNPEVGRRLGAEFGRKLREVGQYQTVDVIVPVPLHPDKQRSRGYNQSTVFAQGIAEQLNVPVMEDALRRREFTSTQTRKKRMARHINVNQVFEVTRPTDLQGKHILLVDDVLTTGATLEECGTALLSVPSTRLSSVTIAIAMKKL
jgi:ComF family protein